MRKPAALIQLTDEEVKTLQEWTRRGKNENRLVERARIILLAHAGQTNEQIAEAMRTRTARVSKWRQRFAAKRLQGLGDGARSGIFFKYDPSTEKAVLALLDEPAPEGCSQWNGRLLAERLPDRGRPAIAPRAARTPVVREAGTGGKTATPQFSTFELRLEGRRVDRRIPATL